jgi:hypothetical protein
MNTKNLWFRWTIFSSIPIVTGVPILLILAIIVLDESLIAYSIVGLLLGAILGASQGFVLQNYGYPLMRWVMMSTIGLGTSIPAVFILYDRNISAGYVAPLAIGLVLGITQTMAFPNYSSINLVWIPASIVGAIVAYFVGSLIDPFQRPLDSPIGVAFILCQAAMLTIPFYGLITGLVIEWITRRKHNSEMSTADELIKNKT